MSTHNILFSIFKKISLNYSKSAATGFFSKGLENKFEAAMVNDPATEVLLNITVEESTHIQWVNPKHQMGCQKKQKEENTFVLHLLVRGEEMKNTCGYLLKFFTASIGSAKYFFYFCHTSINRMTLTFSYLYCPPGGIYSLSLSSGVSDSDLDLITLEHCLRFVTFRSL